MLRNVVKLSDEDIQYYIDTRETVDMDEISALQVTVYVMCGGGWLGHSAAESPADFYIDTRVSKRPYPVKEIYQAVHVLRLLAEAIGLNPHDMPKMPHFHNCGLF